jgi:hypothetical protein
MRGRRFDIDWVRVVATSAVFVFHCLNIFAPIGWSVQNADTSQVLAIVMVWFYVWVMPLLFLLSGFSSWYSLRKRSGGQYLLERVKRLLVPLYTVGILILLVPQGYFQAVTWDGFTGTFWQWVKSYLVQLTSFEISLVNPMGLFMIPYPGHLWFLVHLFLISLIVLPLLLYLRSDAGRRVLETLARWSERWGAIFLFLIPLIVVRVALIGLFPGMSTWAELVYYAVLFMIGYIIASDERFTLAYKRVGWVCLAVGLLAFFAEIVMIGPMGYAFPHSDGVYSGLYVVFQTVMAVNGFCWVLFLLSLGARYLNFGNKALTYAGQAQYPFFSLHMPIVLTVGWFVVRWNLGIFPKFTIILVISFVLIMAIYELLVRRLNVVRFLFGLRPIKKDPVPPAAD